MIIDNKLYDQSEINQIAKIVLQKCNYFHPKNISNNKPHKTGEGLLSMTNGMSVNQFNKTHHLDLFKAKQNKPK